MTALTRAAALLPARPRAAVPSAAGVLGGTTLLLAVAAVAFVVRFGSNLPVYDEWYLIQPLLKNGFRPGWVFEHHNEHRYPLARATWAGLLAATGYDFRAGMLASTGLLAVASFGLLAAARRLRGRSHLADLILPALLLSWGNWFNFLMGYQLAFTLVVAGGAGVLYWVSRAEPGAEPRVGAWAGVFALVLVQNGGLGLGYAGPVGLWLGYLAWRRWADPRPGRWRQTAALAVLPAVVAGYAAFVWATTPPATAKTAHPGPVEAVLAVIGNLEVGLGPAVFPRPWATVAGAVVVLGYAAAVFWCGRAALTRPGERPRAAGLLAVMAGHAITSAGMAWYRGGAMGDRFVTPSVVGLCACWLAAVRYGPRLPAAPGAALGLTAAAAVFGLNLEPGYRAGMIQRSYMKGFVADVRAGLPPAALAGKYGGQWLILDWENANHIANLREARVEAFRDARPDPPFRAVPVPPPEPPEVPASMTAPDVAPGEWVAVPDPPGPAYGLRVKVRQRQSIPWQVLALEWQDGGPRSATAHAPIWEGYQHPVVFWVGGGRPTNVRLRAGCPTYGFDVLSVEWLVAP